MTGIDQFESLFKKASRTPYRFEPVEIRRVLIVTDRTDPASFAERVRTYLRIDADWRIADGFRTVQDLLELADRERPDLICTYRNLHSDGWRWPYSLGEHLDVLTMHTPYPVMVFPHPDAGHAPSDLRTVMAFTDHLTGDHRIVNAAVRFTEPHGTLFLAHVESRADYEHYMDVISKIPEIDTDTAREKITEQLLKEPRDYIESVRAALRERPIAVEPIVTIGRRLDEARKLIRDRKVGLLVMETTDDGQVAMHGLAQPLAVGLREIPILML